MVTLSDNCHCLQFTSWQRALDALPDFNGDVIKVDIGRQLYHCSWQVLVFIWVNLSLGDTVHIQHGGECHHLQDYGDINQLFFNFPMHRAYVYNGVIKVV